MKWVSFWIIAIYFQPHRRESVNQKDIWYDITTVRFSYSLFRKDKIKNFYTDFIIDLIKYRKKHNIVKLDFVEMFMPLKDNPEKLSKVIGKSLFTYLIYLHMVTLYVNIREYLPGNVTLVKKDNYIKINKFKW